MVIVGSLWQDRKEKTLENKMIFNQIDTAANSVLFIFFIRNDIHDLSNMNFQSHENNIYI